MQADGRKRLQDGDMRVPCRGGPLGKSYLRVNPDKPETLTVPLEGGYYELHRDDTGKWGYTWRRK